MPKVDYTALARADLLEAWLFVAEENLNAADQMLETISQGVDLLAQQPLIGRERPDLYPDLRSWPTSTPYIIFYIAQDNGLTVVRVLHHARDIQGKDLVH
jgi:toxin ParE1/3/4